MQILASPSTHAIHHALMAVEKQRPQLEKLKDPANCLYTPTRDDELMIIW